MTEENKIEEKPNENTVVDSEETTTTNSHMETPHTEDKYKAFYEKVTAPIKVNGHMIPFTDPDDIRVLLSKGSDYTRKTTELQQHKGMIALLTNNNINEQELCSLIDVAKGKKEAIIHYAHKAGIDLADVEAIDEIADKAYTPETKKVTPEEQAFSEALLQARQVTEVWNFLNILPASDVAILEKNPQNILAMLSQYYAGDFNKIISEMVRLQAVNKLDTSKGYIAAYNFVMQQLVYQGQLGQPNRAPTNAPVQKPQPTEQQRKGVSTTRANVPSKPTNNAPQGGMSLDEINKLSGDEYSKAFAEWRERMKRNAR